MTFGRSAPDRNGSPTVREPDDAGVVAVEFALVVPLLIVLLFTIIVGGSVYLDQLHLQSAARDAARVGSVAPASACAAASKNLAGNDVGSVSCDLVTTCATGSVQVRLTANQTVSLPIVGVRHVTLRASSTFACKT